MSITRTHWTAVALTGGLLFAPGTVNAGVTKTEIVISRTDTITQPVGYSGLFFGTLFVGGSPTLDYFAHRFPLPAELAGHIKTAYADEPRIVNSIDAWVGTESVPFMYQSADGFFWSVLKPYHGLPHYRTETVFERALLVGTGVETVIVYQDLDPLTVLITIQTNIYQDDWRFTATEVNVYVDPLSTVPEPATLNLLGFGLVLLGCQRRKHQHRAGPGSPDGTTRNEEAPGRGPH
jgi:hypothetical protein